MRSRSRKSGSLKKKVTTLLVIFFAALGLVVFEFYRFVYQPNTGFQDKNNRFLFIKSDYTYDDVIKQLQFQGIVKNINTFKYIAQLKKLPQKFKPGKYRIRKGMNNNQIINMLKAGFFEKETLRFNHINTLPELAQRIAKHTEADSLTVIKEFTARNFESRFGIPAEASLTLVINKTYVLNWATPISDLLELFKKEYKKFWNTERLNKAKKLNLTPTEVTILASIVYKEQMLHPEERPIIASVYYNRLKKGMKLQADPTVIYALGDFSISRVLHKHLNIESPYNTYQVYGLPPGPICIPTEQSIESVLNLPSTDYLFFCAKEDLSGYHYFTKNYQTHLKCAQKYQQTLNKLGIK